MAFERYITIEDQKIFQSEIEKMTHEQVRMTISFCSTEGELRFIRNNCIEGAKHLIDRVIDKLKY